MVSERYAVAMATLGAGCVDVAVCYYYTTRPVLGRIPPVRGCTPTGYTGYTTTAAPMLVVLGYGCVAVAC